MIQNRYLIVQLIGKGGMGEVYLAVDQRLGSAVALKRTFFSEDETLGSAFEREARILGRLRHPVLPKVIDHFAENGDQFLVMEHISGEDIAKRLEGAKKPFPLSWVMFWADQMLDALSYLHSHEPPIVHRDIKPQNLKLTDDNHIVLLDFGLSKDFDTTSGGPGINSASVAGYSPHFASMEQIRGTGTDARSDLYSLSATLYQMLANIIPPDALTRADAMLGGKPDPIRPLNLLNSEISPEISEVLLKGFSLRQDERFETALEMQKTLRRAFNKGKAEPDAKPVMSVSNPQEPPADTSAPKPETAEVEMETNVRVNKKINLDATAKLEAPPSFDFGKPLDGDPTIISVHPLTDDKQAEESVSEDQPKFKYAPTVVSFSPHAETIAVKDPSSIEPPVQGLSRSKKKPTRKTGLVVGLLLGVLTLIAVAGGAGWILSRNSSSSVSPTVLPVANVETNSNPASSGVAETVQPGRLEAASGLGNTDSSFENPPSGTNRPAPQIKTTPSRDGTPPVVKATPKPKAKDDRTVIMP